MKKLLLLLVMLPMYGSSVDLEKLKWANERADLLAKNAIWRLEGKSQKEQQLRFKQEQAQLTLKGITWALRSEFVKDAVIDAIGLKSFGHSYALRELQIKLHDYQMIWNAVTKNGTDYVGVDKKADALFRDFMSVQVAKVKNLNSEFDRSVMAARAVTSREEQRNESHEGVYTWCPVLPVK